MSGLTSSPKLVKGGLVVLDAKTAAVTRTIALQYNPDSLTRSYQVQSVGADGGGERAQPFRVKGPAIESIKIEAEIDATDVRWSTQTRTPTRSPSASRRSSRRLG